MWAAQLDIVGAQRGDSRGALAIEQDQAPGDAGWKLERVALQQFAGLAQAGGLVDRSGASLCRWASDREGGDEPGVVGPVEEVARGERPAGGAGDPFVVQWLAQLLERAATVV